MTLRDLQSSAALIGASLGIAQPLTRAAGIAPAKEEPAAVTVKFATPGEAQAFLDAVAALRAATTEASVVPTLPLVP